jgi:hypothetical protein
MKPFPLLLAVKDAVRMAAPTSDGGGICFLRDRRLLKWRTRNRGASTVAFGLPRGLAMHLSQFLDKSICVATLVKGRRRMACCIYSPDGDLLHSHEWQFDFIVRRVERKGDTLFVIGNERAVAVDARQGGQLGNIAIGRAASHGRYFRMLDGTWKLLTWNGQQLALEPITFPKPLARAEALQFFNREGYEGPWVLTRNGEILSHRGEVIMNLGGFVLVRCLSNDGHRLLVNRPHDPKTILVDLKALKAMPWTGSTGGSDWKSEPSPPVFEVRTQFDRIAFHPPCQVYLHSPKSGWHVIAPEGLQLTLHRLRKEAPENLHSVEFRPMEAMLDQGFALLVARWTDGRRAWLDSRGMLHLRSGIPDVPEVTIALGANSLAAWCSAGEWIGSPFFRGEHPETLASRMWAALHDLCQPTA